MYRLVFSLTLIGVASYGWLAAETAQVRQSFMAILSDPTERTRNSIDP
jgi:hypothetical protein